jgi:glyoxylase-like metal-dependent hydrolase (beta-lactamase superfamily II)
MKIETFFDQTTFTLTYMVYDETTNDAFVIDPVLNYDAASSSITYEQIDALEKFVNDNNLNLKYVLETHAHADHLSSSDVMKKRFPGLKIAISEHITKVQDVFKGVFNISELKTDGSQFDILFKDQDILKIGSLEVKVINTPGHTPACTSFLINDILFTGDALFMPDYGTGRCDFPAGCAEDLYNSVTNKIYTLPDSTKIYVGHDYQPGGRKLKWASTIGESKEKNIQLTASTSKDEYIKFRNDRDATLNAPKLLLQSVQVNINAGVFPDAEDNGLSYLKIPVRK